MTGWYPLNVRESGEYDSYDALSEGVPEWIRDPLCQAIARAFEARTSQQIDPAVVNRCKAALRRVIPDNGLTSQLENWLRQTANSDPGFVLDILDYVLATQERLHSITESILTAGNSAWTVGRWDDGNDGHTGLVRRVDPSVTAAAAQAISAKTAASHHLAQAWQAAYGLNGNPSNAYSHAIKAVEFAAIPVVTPNNHNATLGTVIGQVRTDGDWIVPLTREKNPGHAAGMLLSMLEGLWAGQSDRHGSTLPAVPVTVEAAQTAVLMATTLVQWFQSGAVRRGSI